jgi:hypothetical protein
MKEFTVEPVRVRNMPIAEKTAKDVAEDILGRLDQPRNRGGRRIQSNTTDGVLEVWRDGSGRVHFKHPRLRSSAGDEISIRLDKRGSYLKSGENIFALKNLLESNDVLLSCSKLL